MKIFLIVGICGTGKTWVMKQLMSELDISKTYSYKNGLYTYLKKNGIILIGNYDGSTFEGSDKLSMSIMKDNPKMVAEFEDNIVVCEGDRFTNSTFINTFKPTIIKIKGDGSEGRTKRGSSQTERHLKSITTRVSKIQADVEVENSEECLNFLIKEITNVEI